MSLERTVGSWTGVVRTLALTAAGCLAAAPDLHAQGGEELDAGTYEILLNGELVGLERFVVQSDGAAVRAVGDRVSTRARPSSLGRANGPSAKKRFARSFGLRSGRKKPQFVSNGLNAFQG